MQKIKGKISKKNIIQLTSVILAAGITVALLFILLKPSGIRPQNGVLDLSERKTSETVNLNGEWDFYWGKLLSYEDVLAGAEKDLTADTSEHWISYKIGGKKLPAFGYATYVLKVKNAAAGERLAINIPSVSTAYELYVNGSLLASGGTVGTDAESHKPETKRKTALLTVTDTDFFVIIRVSNYSTAYGGLYSALILGSSAQIDTINQTNRDVDIFTLGGLLVMIIYYLNFTFLSKDEKVNRIINNYIVAAYILYALRVLIHSDILAISGFDFILRADYLLLFWFSVCGLNMFGTLYPKEFHKYAQIGLLIYAVIMSFVVLVTPISFFTQFVIIYEVISLAVGLYLIAGVSLALLRSKNYAFTLLISAFVVLLCSLKELFFSNIPILGYTGELIPICVLFLLVMQPFLHARYTMTSLNRIVDTETAFMQAQIKPHFLYNVLSAISSYCETDPGYAQKLINDFSSYLRLSFDFKKIESCVPIEREISLVKAYVQIQTARFPDLLSVEYEIGGNIAAEVPLLSIQPLVENAVIHGILKKETAGVVRVKIAATGGGTAVTVTDDGAGIPAEKLQDLLSEENERGIGLFNINKRLIKICGKGLVIESAEGAGTTVSYTVPAKKRKK